MSQTGLRSIIAAVVAVIVLIGVYFATTNYWATEDAAAPAATAEQDAPEAME